MKVKDHNLSSLVQFNLKGLNELTEHILDSVNRIQRVSLGLFSVMVYLTIISWCR